jgi:hypothetical protein
MCPGRAAKSHFLPASPHFPPLGGRQWPWFPPSEDEIQGYDLDQLIDQDRFFLSPRVQMLRAIRNKIQPEPIRQPLPPPQKFYDPPRATAKQRRRR